MNLTCANCGSKLSYSAGKINISVQPCKNGCHVWGEDSIEDDFDSEEIEEETDD